MTVKDYDKASGVDLETGTTTYMDLDIDQDKAVNELIDGYDAAAVPDNLVADRLDSAGYSLALEMDKKCINVLETTSGVNICATKTAATEETAYKEIWPRKLIWDGPVFRRTPLADRIAGIYVCADDG